MRHICCCLCCLPSTSHDQLTAAEANNKGDTDRISFDLKNVQIVPTFDSSSFYGHYEAEAAKHQKQQSVFEQDQQQNEDEAAASSSTKLRISPIDHFIFDMRRTTMPVPKRQSRRRESASNSREPVESYGPPSTSNWTETDSSETSSPVFTPAWRRRRRVVKFFQHQRRYNRTQTQHPRRIYAAHHQQQQQQQQQSLRRAGPPADWRRECGGDFHRQATTANSSSTNSLSSTPGPLKRFSCRNLFQFAGQHRPPTTLPRQHQQQPQQQQWGQLRDLHFKAATTPLLGTLTPTTNPLPPLHQQQQQQPKFAGIRPLHRTLSTHLLNNKLKLPTLSEEEAPAAAEGIATTAPPNPAALSPATNIADLISTSQPGTSAGHRRHRDKTPNSQSATVHDIIVGFRRRISHLSLTSNFSSDASFYFLGHRRRPFEDSTAYTTETEGRIYSDDESRLSTSTDNITSVSRQHYGLYRRRRRQLPPRSRRQPSRASSLSSMTETSMALEVITVTLNMDTVNFLGISIVGQSSSRGDNGIYVASVMPGGAVALDGCIEPGDMILQVNDISFENFKNDQAVEVLKQAVSRRGPIKLTVAKSFDAGRANYFSVPAREPVRPIDTHAWVQHTNAVRGMSNTLVSAMNAIPEGSEGAPTPIPGQYPPPPQGGQLVNAFMSGMVIHQQQHQQNQQRPASSSTTATSNGSGVAGGGAQTILGPGGVFLAVQPRLDLHTDRRKVVQTMAAPNSGLDIRDRTWLKIPIPMSFLGSSLVDWLLENVNGLRDRKEARRYAADLLKERLIAHVVNKQQFTEQCYYVFGDECAELLSLRNGGGAENGANNLQHQQQQHMTSQGMLFMNQQQQLPPSYIQQQTNIGSSEYASMPPVSPYPPAAGAAIQMMEFSRPQQQQQMLAQQPQKFSQTIFGPPGGLNPMVVQQHQRMAADHQQQQQQPQMGTTSQTSNNSNEESSGSEQRRKAILPPAPSLTSLGGPQHQQQAQFMQQQQKAHQQQYNATGAPPSTPIGEEAASLGNAGRFAGQTF